METSRVRHKSLATILCKNYGIIWPYLNTLEVFFKFQNGFFATTKSKLSKTAN